MNKQLELKNKLNEEQRRILTCPRECLHPGCTATAIGSHVLQKHPILKSIVDKTNHFYWVKIPSIFEMREDKHFSISKVGLDSGYKFPGFCNEHDSGLFKDIETHPVDLFNARNQALFTYRAICLELRKKEFYLETCQSILATHKAVEPHKFHYVDFEPARLAIKDLEFFKLELEADLNSGTINKHNFTTLVLPEKKICLSSSLTIFDPQNKLTWEEDEYGRTRQSPLVTSTINYFPYQGQSYMILATHKKFPCRWTKELILSLSNKNRIDKILSDLLTYRAEFWGISPDIYESIPDDKKVRFLQESEANWDNYDFNISTSFNLFS